MRLLLLSSFIKMNFHLSKVQLSFYPTSAVVLSSSYDYDEDRATTTRRWWKQTRVAPRVEERKCYSNYLQCFYLYCWLFASTLCFLLCPSMRKNSQTSQKVLLNILFTTSNFFILQYSHKDCLASYATETVMQYCHGRRRVCRCCSVCGTFLIEKHF